ncbi:MAG: phosphoribosylaminoimidazolesuccinocarboxamide synthase [Candidatus Jordarchaeales archaeon]|nr:phosphoribosylaminoimidazolesuccinocarboxamide synthase [Candidatus Jordarchaeia archaeon]
MLPQDFSKLEIIGEGKTKIVRRMDNPELVLLEFKDAITALDGEKKDTITGKGHINARISGFLFEFLSKEGVPTHYVSFIEPKYMVVKRLKMLPVEVVCRNIAAGSFAKRYPVEAGSRLKHPVVEYYLKDDLRHDPMMNEDHMVVLGILSSIEEVNEIKRLTLTVNKALSKFLDDKGITLVDFKLEFGRDRNGRIYVGDEINGDSMRLWDKRTGRILDKDVYRQGKNLSEVLETYRECYRRIIGEEPRV